MLLLLAAPFMGVAQNHGQVNENGAGRIDFLGYEPTSQTYAIGITNLKACTIDFRIEWQGKDTVVTIQGFQTRQVSLPAAKRNDDLIKAKATTAPCAAPDLGWIEIWTPYNLPVRFTYINVKKVDAENIKVTFETEEDEGVKEFHIMVSLDGKTFFKVAVTPVRNPKTKQYEALIKINSLKS